MHSCMIGHGGGQLHLSEIDPKPEHPSLLLLPDPDDAWILASAVNARADVHVTGDKPFLSVAGQVKEILLVSPRGFLDMRQTKRPRH